MNISKKYLTFSVGLSLFILSFVLFFWWGYDLSFTDPDSFYHVKMAELIKDQGPVLDFPWQQFTLLKDSYIDHHLLYHYLLIPFTYLGSPLIGAKLATFFLASLFIVIFYLFLTSQSIKFPWVWAGLLAITTPFSFRLNLTKTSALSLIILYLGFYLITKKKNKLLFLLSFLYVWTYGGFLVLLILASFYLTASLIKKKKYFISWLTVLGGLLTGLIINPYFPKNLDFYWQQLVQIGILNYQDTIGVGGEWYPYHFWTLISATPILSALLIISFFVFIYYFKKQSALSWTSALWALLFLILTLKSRRYIEYYVPAAIFFIALNLSQLKNPLPKIISYLKPDLWPKIIFTSLSIYIILVSTLFITKDCLSQKKNLSRGTNWQQFAQASSWLENNTPPGTIIMQADWDDWPILFYHNTHNYYIVGLDPTFMYNYDSDLYWTWAKLTLNRSSENLKDVLNNKFNCQYFILDQSHPNLDRRLKTDPNFDLVYQDEKSKIYKTK